MTPRLAAVSVALVGVLHPLPGAAQTVEKASNAVKLATLDLGVPDSPAFAILGLSPESIVRPASPRDLAATVLNGLDRQGNLQSGIALDFAPRFLFAGNALTYNRYHDSPVTRVSARTQLSFATAKGTSDSDKSRRTAVGVRITLWDKGDPRLDKTLVDCLDAITVQAPDEALTNEERARAWEATQTAAIKPRVEACHSASKNRSWNASGLAIGVAPSWQSPTGETADFQYAGSALWSSLAIGLTSHAATANPRRFGQLIVQGRYRNKELVASKDDPAKFHEQDSAGLGARLLVGAADRAAVFESELTRQSPKGSDATTSLTVSGGGQLKLAADVWLSLAVGGSTGGDPNAKRGIFVLSSFKWALSREPGVQIPQP
jgi:hypothetical protein